MNDDKNVVWAQIYNRIVTILTKQAKQNTELSPSELAADKKSGYQFLIAVTINDQVTLNWKDCVLQCNHHGWWFGYRSALDMLLLSLKDFNMIFDTNFSTVNSVFSQTVSKILAHSNMYLVRGYHRGDGRYYLNQETTTFEKYIELKQKYFSTDAVLRVHCIEISMDKPSLTFILYSRIKHSQSNFERPLCDVYVDDPVSFLRPPCK